MPRPSNQPEALTRESSPPEAQDVGDGDVPTLAEGPSAPAVIAGERAITTPPASNKPPRTVAEIDSEIDAMKAKLDSLRRLRTVTARFERDRDALMGDVRMTHERSE